MLGSANTNMILPLVLLALALAVAAFIYTLRVIPKNIEKRISEFIESESKSHIKYKNDLKDQNDILIKQLMQQVAAASESASSGKNSYRENEKALFGVFQKLRNAIKENCIVTMNKIGAVRIAIYLLHNGTTSTHGISFFKMSCICEKVAIGSGVRERMLEHTNIPINLFDEMIDKLASNSRFIIMNDENLVNTNNKIFISADKINYTQLIAIYDINNNMLGFVAAEMDKPYSKSSADKEKEYIDELVKQLVPALSYADDYKEIKTV